MYIFQAMTSPVSQDMLLNQGMLLNHSRATQLNHLLTLWWYEEQSVMADAGIVGWVLVTCGQFPTTSRKHTYIILTPLNPTFI